MHSDRPHPHYEDDAIVNPETHHEKTDVSVRALIWFIIIFAIFGVITHIVLWLLYKGYVNFEKRRQLPEMTEITKPSDISVPKNQPLLQPFPRVQSDGKPLPPNRTTPISDLADMRDAEHRALSSYGWVDQQHGIVRIPIDQAMQLTLQRGLPVQSAMPSAPPPAPAAGTAQRQQPQPRPAVSPGTGAHP